MRILLLIFCALTLLATTGCIIPVEEEGGGRGHYDHGYHEGGHGGDNH